MSTTPVTPPTVPTPATITKVSHAKFEKDFCAASLYLNIHFPFYGSLLANFKVHTTSDIETMCIDVNDNLFINPDFFVGMGGVATQAWGLAHETLHPALGIFFRGRDHIPEVSNIAHDFVINLLLELEDTRWRWPHALFDLKYRDMAYEQVYASLLKDARKSSRGGKKSKGGSGAGGSGVAPAPGSRGRGGKGAPMSDVIFSPEAAWLPAEAQRQSQIWTSRITAAYEFAKSRGLGSLAAEQILELAQGATVDWRDHLRAAVQEANSHSRLNWNMPARRTAALGIFMPQERILGADATVVVDTSGSIVNDQKRSALREIDGIIQICGKVRWLAGDTEVLQDGWISQAPARIVGQGGTDFRPFFEHLQETEATRLLVYFTDTDGIFPDEAPDFPVLWIVYDDVAMPKVPFGEIIRIPATV